MWFRWSVLAFFLCINVFLYQEIFSYSDTLTVAFLDVGQGDAVYIRAPNGNDVLIDGGAHSGVLRELGKVIPFADRSIDVVMGTHPDKDHIGGLVFVFNRYAVDAYLEPPVEDKSSVYGALIQEVKKEEATHLTAVRGSAVSLGDGVVLYVLSPHIGQSGNANDRSVVAKLVYRNTSFLLTGDAGIVVERNLAHRYGDFLESEVLKVGHHGSDTSSDERFLFAVNPDAAVISAGEDNTYGHPHENVVARLQSVGAEVVGTYESGTIIFESDGIVIQRKD